MSKTNNYISIRNILHGMRPHIVPFNDRDERDRERALVRAQAIAGTRDFAKVSAIWKAAGPPLASIPVVGAPAKEKIRAGYLPPEARHAAQTGEQAAGSVE